MLKKKIGLRIKAIRKSRNLSQLMLSEKSNISERFLRYIESGEKNYSLSTLYKILNALDIDFSNLFSTKNEGDLNHEQENE